MKPLTGTKVLLIAVSAFAVIIGVNMTLAFSAVRTFPGLEVQNSYIASQQFDASRTAQEGLGWTLDARLEEGALVLAFTDAAGNPVQGAALEATLGRATHVRDDMVPEFAYGAGVYSAPADLGPGNWNIRLTARAFDGTEFRQRVVLQIDE